MLSWDGRARNVALGSKDVQGTYRQSIIPITALNVAGVPSMHATMSIQFDSTYAAGARSASIIFT
jgi:hypothetical protein